jgi:hypothetical protein
VCLECAVRHGRRPNSRCTDFNRLLVAVCIFLVLATVIVYGQTFRYGFIAYDDDQYVYDNPIVKVGLTSSGVAWALQERARARRYAVKRVAAI